MATLIKVNGVKKTITPGNGKKFELEEAQKLVGGYIQIIYLDNGEVMILDEEGKLKGYPANQTASFIALSRGAIHLTDYIVGDVVICKEHEI